MPYAFLINGKLHAGIAYTEHDMWVQYSVYLHDPHSSNWIGPAPDEVDWDTIEVPEVKA